MKTTLLRRIRSEQSMGNLYYIKFSKTLRKKAIHNAWDSVMPLIERYRKQYKRIRAVRRVFVLVRCKKKDPYCPYIKAKCPYDVSMSCEKCPKYCHGIVVSKF